MATAEKKPTAIESVPDGHSVIKGKGVMLDFAPTFQSRAQ